MTEPAARPRRRTMGPALLAAAASGALLAVAGDRGWVAVDGAPEPTEGTGQQVASGLDLAARNPVVTALALVALAALGVVLVTRGRARRVIAALALLAATGAAVAVVLAWTGTRGRVTDEVAGGPLADAALGWTLWAWASLPASALLLVACAVTLRDVGRWPEMGRRYDAPGAGAVPRSTAPLEERSSLELWKAMDAGDDPTDDERRQTPLD